MTESEIILNTLNVIETKQEERHIENRNKFATLFKKTDEIFAKVGKLNCAVHEERMKNIIVGLNCLWVMLIVVVVGGIVLGIWVKAATAIN